MKPLTARGVKAMLARAGVDYAALTITDAPGAQVKILGSRESRRQAWHVLFDKGLVNAPYITHDFWSRPRGARA